MTLIASALQGWMKELLDRRKEAKDSMTRGIRKVKGKKKKRYLLISEKKRQNFTFFFIF